MSARGSHAAKSSRLASPADCRIWAQQELSKAVREHVKKLIEDGKAVSMEERQALQRQLDIVLGILGYR